MTDDARVQAIRERLDALVASANGDDEKQRILDTTIFRLSVVEDMTWLLDELQAVEAVSRRLQDAAEMLWVVLANVSGGDWKQQSQEWQEAAAHWRDNYFAALKAAALLTGGAVNADQTK